MAVNFDEDFGAEIAEISGSAEYQNCDIQIRDPSAQTFTVDVETGNSNLTGDSLIWSGQGRVSMLRSSVDVGGNSSTDPSAIKGVRVQIPHGSYSNRIRKGWFIRVVSGGRNSGLMTYNLVVDSDVQGSHEASTTIQCSINVEQEPNWSA